MEYLIGWYWDHGSRVCVCVCVCVCARARACVNDFPLSINTISDTIMFADYASALISNRNFNAFMDTFNMVILHVTTWFHANSLS